MRERVKRKEKDQKKKCWSIKGSNPHCCRKNVQKSSALPTAQGIHSKIKGERKHVYII